MSSIPSIPLTLYRGLIIIRSTFQPLNLFLLHCQLQIQHELSHKSLIYFDKKKTSLMQTSLISYQIGVKFYFISTRKTSVQNRSLGLRMMEVLIESICPYFLFRHLQRASEEIERNIIHRNSLSFSLICQNRQWMLRKHLKTFSRWNLWVLFALVFLNRFNVHTEHYFC